MTEKRVLIIGRMSMSLIMNMFKLPELGEYAVDDGGVAYMPGGEGAGVAMAYARLGADALLSGKIGADAHGQRLYKYYKDQGVNTSLIKVDREEPTALSVIMREAAGERTLVYPGAGAKYSPENVSEALSHSPDALHLSFGLPWGLVVGAARSAAYRGVPIIAHATEASSEQALEALPELELFLLDDKEAFAYTGIMPESSESSLRCALALYKRIKAKYVVIRQGERGAFIYDGKKYFIIGAPKAGKMVDTSSMPEAFVAALTLEFLRTEDIRASVRFALSSAALTAAKEGSFSTVPTDGEVRQFMLKSGFGY